MVWDPQGEKGTMHFPLSVVKRKGKNKFNGIVTSMCAEGGWLMHPLRHEN